MSDLVITIRNRPDYLSEQELIDRLKAWMFCEDYEQVGEVIGTDADDRSIVFKKNDHRKETANDSTE